jgi:hypothetical protein
MSRDTIEDLEVDEARAERMDALFASLDPGDHAARIVAMGDAPELASDLWELREKVGWKAGR